MPSEPSAKRSPIRLNERQIAVLDWIKAGCPGSVYDDEDYSHRISAGLAEPETTKDPVWDAAIAAVVAWRLRSEEFPTPDWVDARNRFVHERQGLGVDTADPIPPDSEVPEEFAKRGVLVWRDTFASV